ncbi:MAG: leucine-rich repeat domain-containing protein [Oscillospiraceae bacterium]|nr:leucine-rich repeat domain-containing protein [Oscillospiraceae bacterium]
MRTRIKTLISIMFAMIVICSLSVIVSANGKELVDSGRELNYDWEYYSDNTMKITPSISSLDLSSENFPEGYLNADTEVTIEITDAIANSYGYYNCFTFNGRNCEATNFSFTGNKINQLTEFYFYHFNNGINSAIFPESTHINYVSIAYSNITTIDFLEGIAIDTLQVYSCPVLKSVSASYPIGQLDITNCDNVARINIPDGLDFLYVNDAPLVEELDIPSSLRRCFLYNVSVSEITVPKNCNLQIRSETLETATLITGRDTINWWMFDGCSKLNSVNIPYGVTKIEYGAFEGCKSLKSVRIPDTVQEIWSRAFLGSGITSATIPDGVTSIEYGVFRGCGSLKKIVIPDTITTINASAFGGTDALKEVVFDGSVTEWNNITIIPDGDVKTIDQVFKNATITFRSFIEKQPEDYVGPLNSTATFSVESSAADSTYQWQYLNGNTWVNSNKTGAKTNQLSVKLTEARDGQRYRCIVTDATGRKLYSKDAKMLIGTPLAITKMPENAYVNPDEDVSFTVEAVGDGLKYRWYAYIDEHWMLSSEGKSLTIEPYSYRYGLDYKYRCTVYDKYGKSITTNEVAIYILEDLKINRNPSDFTGTAGSKATFAVDCSGNGLKYQWQYRTSGSSWKNSNSEGYDTPSMTVKITEKRDGQQYRCKVTDMNQNVVYSKAATIHLAQQVLAITNQPSDFTGKIGTMATFTVGAEGDDINYQWQYMNESGVWKNSNATGSTTSSMSIKITDARDGQKYMCVVTDKFGNRLTSLSARIVAEKEPAIKITSQPSSVSGVVGTKATFTVVAEGKALTYQWQYKSVSDTYWKNSTKEGSDTSSISVKITDARNGQMYRCIISDADGNEITSDEATITVQKSQPKITEQPVDYSGAIGTLAVFTVDAEGEGLTYQWQYSKDGTTWKNSSLRGYDTAILNVKVTEARVGQMYRCVITDCYGYTVTSDAVTIETF